MSERFTPKMFVDWWAKEQGRTVQDFGVSPVVLVSWHLTQIQELAKTVGAEIPKDWFYGKKVPVAHWTG